MLTSFLRNSAFTLAAVAGLAASAPAAEARDYGQIRIITTEDAGPVREIQRHQNQRHHWDDEVLSGREIAHALRYQGYRDIRSIELRGDDYRVIAIRRNGAVMRLRVDASSGRIMTAVLVGWVRYRPMGEDYPDYPRPDFPRPDYPRPHHHGDGVTFEFGWSSER